VHAGHACAAIAIAATLLLSGCASGAGPDRPTDRACKELSAADHAMSALPTGDLSAVTEDQARSARSIADQLKTIATDSSGGALAERLSALSDLAQQWAAGWASRDSGAVAGVRQQITADLQACADAGVI
jgi:hypothetical protein